MTGIPVETLATIDSTNAEAKRRAQSGMRGPVWLRADAQTAGVGRSGREWHSPQGNLFATLLTPWAGKLGDAALMSFVACLAVADALDFILTDDATFARNELGGSRHSGDSAVPPPRGGALRHPSERLISQQDRVTLKWPNDALLDGKKVAGVLLEAGSNWLAIGIGINLAHKPTETRWPAIALADVTSAPTPADVLSIVARAFDNRQRQFETEGFAPIRTAWLARAARLGETIEARLANASHSGIFNGIAEDGALLLGTDTGEKRLAAADIYFPT